MIVQFQLISRDWKLNFEFCIEYLSFLLSYGSNKIKGHVSFYIKLKTPAANGSCWGTKVGLCLGQKQVLIQPWSHTSHRLYGQCDNWNLTGTVLLDLQKFCDTVDHNILLSKLQAHGFDWSSVSWFKAYLFRHFQIADVNETISQPRGVNSFPDAVSCLH